WTPRTTGISRVGGATMRLRTAWRAAGAGFRSLGLMLVADFGIAAAFAAALAVRRTQFALGARRSG
ncbi:hypothetical protein, partial [Mesorhizobium sp. M0633]|uniref:hypothetical protein n=1 Tax=Mesorhizobium sp. M0633 TaxID=2956977 RepID=UPI00333CE13B